MNTFTYSKIPLSIEDTAFTYLTNIDDYRTLLHILDVITLEKITKPLLKGIFEKVSQVIGNTIKSLEKCLKDDKVIDISKLEKLIKTGDNLFILVNNPNYYSYASYLKDFENNEDNMVYSNSKCILYNVGQLESNGSISVVPNNANAFLSSILYAYTLLHHGKLYSRLNVDILVKIATIYYSMMISSFGRRSGLLVASRDKKEMLYFLICSFVYSIYIPNSKSLSNLRQFLSYAASVSGSNFLNEYLITLSKVTNGSSDIYDKENYNSLDKISNLSRRMEILEISESEIKIQWFRLLGSYGVMGLENYPRLAAYVCGTYIPNSQLSSTMKIYNKASYEYLMEYLLKDIYSF